MALGADLAGDSGTEENEFSRSGIQKLAVHAHLLRACDGLTGKSFSQVEKNAVSKECFIEKKMCQFKLLGYVAHWKEHLTLNYDGAI